MKLGDEVRFLAEKAKYMELSICAKGESAINIKRYRGRNAMYCKRYTKYGGIRWT